MQKQRRNDKQHQKERIQALEEAMEAVRRHGPPRETRR